MRRKDFILYLEQIFFLCFAMVFLSSFLVQVFEFNARGFFYELYFFVQIFFPDVADSSCSVFACVLAYSLSSAAASAGKQRNIKNHAGAESS